jgi:CpXC protein
VSTTGTVEVACPACSRKQIVLAVESANVQRLPEFRRQLLGCTFMRFACVACAHFFVVERELLWTDLKLAMIGAQPNLYRPSLQAVDERILWLAGVGSSAEPFGIDRRAYETMQADEARLQILLPALFTGAHVSAI